MSAAAEAAASAAAAAGASAWCCSCSMLCWLGLGLLAAAWWKSLPLVFHLRIVWQVLKALLCPRRLRAVTDSVVFQDSCALSEMDFNMHMNNSCYYAVADLARIKWFGAFFPSVGQLANIRLANGGVMLYFLHEIKPLAQYQLRVRAASADDKWLYLHHEFVSAKGKVHAVGLCRVVFKERPSGTSKSKAGAAEGAAGAGAAAPGGRTGGARTIPPVELLKRYGYAVPDGFFAPSRREDGSTGEPHAAPGSRTSDAAAAALAGPLNPIGNPLAALLETLAPEHHQHGSAHPKVGQQKQQQGAVAEPQQQSQGRSASKPKGQ